MSDRSVRMRRSVAIALANLVAVASTACIGPSPEPMPRFDGAPVTVGSLQVPARVSGDYLELGIDGGFEPRFWAGVNLGSTIPGHNPGEVAATRTDYDRWIAGMADLGVTVVRVYTILRPAFYDAVLAHNTANPDRPLYVIHGIWVPDEEHFVEHGDLYATEVTDGFRQEISDIVAVIHGDADLPPRHGHASGRYRSDISRWVLAWALGLEWDPHAVLANDEKHGGREGFEGPYFSSASDATPTETWLAEMLDHTASADADRGWSRPLTFTNWPTTDPLHHPYEPYPMEDAVSIDSMNITASDAWPGGFFASYHVYPYYPDFMARQPEHLSYRRPRDRQIDPYSGYLNRLREHHRGQAVMVTEFGVPTSLGLAHHGPLGRDQGGIEEAEAGRIAADMFHNLLEERYAGAILFAYTDEWFKFSWNTPDAEVGGERRALWHDVLNNEQFFGVVATEPGEEPVVVVDGRDGEWRSNGSVAIAESRGPVLEMRAAHDAAYLYLLLTFERRAPWHEEVFTIGFDVRPDGNRGLPDLPGVYPEADVAVRLGIGDEARIRHAAWADPFRVVYGSELEYLDMNPATLVPGSGFWVPPQMMLSRPITDPLTGEEQPAAVAGLGSMRWGNADPDARDFDSRTLVAGRGRTVELRIPWGLLGFADPSSRLALVPVSDGGFGTVEVDGIGIAVASEDGTLLESDGYSWDEWNRVRWRERPKAGWGAVSAAVAKVSSSVP